MNPLIKLALHLVILLITVPTSHAAGAEHAATADTPVGAKAATKKLSDAAPASVEKDIATGIKSALQDKLIDKKRLTLVINDAPVSRPASTVNRAHDTYSPAVARTARGQSPAVVNPKTSRRDNQSKAAALTGHETPPADSHAEVHWSYEGENGPQAWGKLKPEFNICATGKRQSPINIEETGTLQGPAEPLQFNYQPSSGVVVNNGHTIQVNLFGDNVLMVRGSAYKLVQFHFHTPSEEQINYRSFAMVAHLVHKNSQDQLAVVSVLFDSGTANPLIDKVWTYMPLDVNDQVNMPAGMLDMNDLLPRDQRYYQFIGSLTTPPCTEGVLWMVLKQSVQISKEQLKLFQQLYPNNARPVQPVNGRPVRNAQ